jgi:hypothetical protein
MAEAEERASGGVSETDTSFGTMFDDIREKMTTLNVRDRRRTVQQLSDLFLQDEDTRTKQSNDKPPPRVSLPKPPSQGSISPNPPAQVGIFPQPQAQVSHSTPFSPLEYSKKLKPFSGRLKPNPGELDYKHWRRAAIRVIEDIDISENQSKRIILNSLAHNAEDNIDPHRELTTTEIIEILDKLYGEIVDSGDLLADFYQQSQGKSQTASEFLNVLFLNLSDVIAAGGLAMDKLPSTLAGQFARGSHDEDLINKLSLDDIESTLSFPDLLARVRKVEARRTQRRLRHKHITRAQSAISANTEELNTDPNTSSNTQPNQSIPNSKENEVLQLQQRITQLENKVKEQTPKQSTKQFVSKQKRANKIFCYRCGVDDHFATKCSNPPNEALVKEKVEARKKQSN